jgi:hypothetical protein
MIFTNLFTGQILLAPETGRAVVKKKMQVMQVFKFVYRQRQTKLGKLKKIRDFQVGHSRIFKRIILPS